MTSRSHWVTCVGWCHNHSWYRVGTGADSHRHTGSQVGRLSNVTREEEQSTPLLPKGTHPNRDATCQRAAAWRMPRHTMKANDHIRSSKYTGQDEDHRDADADLIIPSALQFICPEFAYILPSIRRYALHR